MSRHAFHQIRRQPQGCRLAQHHGPCCPAVPPRAPAKHILAGDKWFGRGEWRAGCSGTRTNQRSRYCNLLNRLASRSVPAAGTCKVLHYTVLEDIRSSCCCVLLFIDIPHERYTAPFTYLVCATHTGDLSSFATSSLSRLFQIPVNAEKSLTREEQESVDRALRCVRHCRIDELFLDTKFLQPDPLLELVRAVTWASGAQSFQHPSPCRSQKAWSFDGLWEFTPEITLEEWLFQER